MPSFPSVTSFNPACDARQSLFDGRHVRLQSVKAPAQAAEHAPVQADNGYANTNDCPEFSTHRRSLALPMMPALPLSAVPRRLRPCVQIPAPTTRGFRVAYRFGRTLLGWVPFLSAAKSLLGGRCPLKRVRPSTINGTVLLVLIVTDNGILDHSCRRLHCFFHTGRSLHITTISPSRLNAKYAK